VFDIGGGDSFTDIYGPRRFFSMWIAKARTLWARKPLVLSPQTIGPFNTWWAKPLARIVMNRAAFVVSRDTPSTEFLKQMQVRSPIVEATDVAMGLHYTAPPPRAADAPVKVGLNVSGLLFNGGYTRSNQFGLQVDYPALIREIMGWLADRPEVELHLVPHVQSEHIEVEDDRRASIALCAEFPNTHLAPIFASPNAAKSYIAEMDFFIGARMHATIAAFSAGVPVIPMAYSRKFSGVFGTLGYFHVADCKADTQTTIMSRIQRGYLEREALAAEIARAIENVDRRLAAYTKQSHALIVLLHS
jgi:polysaccharide pyruvyl transferase WcaK-like protein